MLMLLVSSLVFLFMPRLIAVGVYLAHDRARQFGGKDKLLWSVTIETLFSLFFSPLVMIDITRFLWLWLKRKGIAWDTQARGDEPLPWRTCIRYFGWVSVLGAVCLAAMLHQLATVPWTQQVLLSAASGGLVAPLDLLLWFSPILFGFTFSIAIARFTSRTFPALAERRLFTIPEETDPPAVVRAVLFWEEHFRSLSPDARDSALTVRRALRDPQFYVRHRRETRVRAGGSKAVLSKIAERKTLDRDDLMLVLKDRVCFDALHIAVRDLEYRI